jgi:hypothetical protein
LHDEPASDLTDDEFAKFSLFAVSQRPKGCFYCQDDGHLLGDCTKFKDLKADPFASKIVRRFLDPRPSTPSPSSQPSTPSASLCLCQLGFDTDTSDPDSPSEEGSSSSLDDEVTNEVSDFRSGRQ